MGPELQTSQNQAQQQENSGGIQDSLATLAFTGLAAATLVGAAFSEDPMRTLSRSLATGLAILGIHEMRKECADIFKS